MFKGILLIANIIFLLASIHVAIEDEMSNKAKKKGYAAIILLFALNAAYIIGS